MPTAELIFDAHARLGEGPVWLESTDELLWIDMEVGDVHWLDYATGRDRSLNVGSHVGVALPARASSLVLGVPKGLARLAAGSDIPTPLVDLGHGTDMVMNDGACDRQGRLWIGSVAVDEAPERGTLYRVDSDLRAEPVLDRVTISNGIDWSLDSSLMYFVDSPTRRVDVLDYDVTTGTAANRRPFHTFADDASGIPDGLCIDAEGSVWVAIWGGSRVVGLTPNGQEHTHVEVASTHVTSCAFGGPDMRTLFITSATSGLDKRTLTSEPHSGGIFAADVGTAGLPPTPFAT